MEFEEVQKVISDKTDGTHTLAKMELLHDRFTGSFCCHLEMGFRYPGSRGIQYTKGSGGTADEAIKEALIGIDGGKK